MNTECERCKWREECVNVDVIPEGECNSFEEVKE